METGAVYYIDVRYTDHQSPNFFMVVQNFSRNYYFRVPAETTYCADENALLWVNLS